MSLGTHNIKVCEQNDPIPTNVCYECFNVFVYLCSPCRGPVLHLRWPAVAALLKSCATAQHLSNTASSSSRPIISFHTDDIPSGAPSSKLQSAQPNTNNSAMRDVPENLSILLQLELLSESLDALECLEGDELLPVLSIVRSTWRSLHSQCHNTQVKAAVDVAAEASESETAVALAWRVVRAVCSCTSASNKRRSSLCAAVVNTVLLPQVFAASDASSGACVSLHAQDGPMHWGLKRAMDWVSVVYRT